VLLAALAALAGATLQSATGFGLVLVLGPALFGVFEPEQALTMLFVLSGILNLLVLLAEGRRREVATGQLSIVLLAALPGVVCGVLILQALAKPTLQVVVGFAVLAATAIQARELRVAGVSSSPSSLVVPGAVGFVTGILTTSTGTSGPPLVLWFQRLGLGPVAMRDTLAAAFFVLNIVGAAALFTLGEDPGLPGAASAALLVALALAGYLAGRAAFERLHPRRFRTLGLLLVGAAGLASIIAGLAG